MYDYRSPYANYSTENRENILRETLGLPRSFKEDEVFKAAKARYMEFIETPTSKALVSTKQGLDKTYKLVDVLTEEIETTIQRLQTLDGEDEEDDDKRHKYIKRALDSLDKIIDISGKLPKTVATLDELRSQIQKETMGDTKLQGGGRLGAYEE